MTKEELKTATNEELIDELDYCGYDSYYREYRDDIIAEIKKRMKNPCEDAAYWKGFNNCIRTEKFRESKQQESCENWYDISSDEMTLEQARQAVKNLRKKLANYLDQPPCENCSIKYELEVNVKKWADAYSRGLKDGLKEQPCKDVVSRKAVAEFLGNHAKDFEDARIRMAFMTASSLVENANNIPPVTPTRKKGKWIEDGYYNLPCVCSYCGNEGRYDMKYCPNCGAEMESE